MDIKKCTCLILVASILLIAEAEILNCPIHGNHDCFRPHTDPVLVSLTSVSGSIQFSNS